MTDSNGRAGKHRAVCFIGLGTNLGHRAENLARALWLLDAEPRLCVAAVSSVYETAPEGVTEQPSFLNMVAALHTEPAHGTSTHPQVGPAQH